LVAACIAAGQKIEVIPGPSAVPSALVLSGLPTARFVFEGFLPRTAGARTRRLEQLATEQRTLVFFEAPHRIGATLAAMANVLGPRRAALARELTKIHEEVVRDTLPVLAEHVRAHPPRGEITLVVEGATDAEPPAAGDVAAEVAAMIDAGVAKKEAIAAVAKARGVPKRIVYQAVLDAPPH
jgi:16S rRNA (cytidine1402-2'-O)-methyltransferase